MHIVVLVLAVLGGLAAWYWRIKSIGEAGRDAAEIAGTVRGAYRRSQFRKKVDASPLANITDPAMAAAVFLYALAMENRETLHLSEPAIREQIGTIVPTGELDQVLSYAEWAARHVADPRDVARRFKPLWRERLTSQERTALIAMAEIVMSVGGREPDYNQKLSFTTLRTALSPEQYR